LWPKHWAYDASIAPFAFNQRQSVALLDGAGFNKGRAGTLSSLPSARLKFTCLLVEGFSLHERLGLELQKQLYDIGVDMQFEVVSPQAFNDRVRDGKFEAVLIDMISGPSFGRPYIFWRSAKEFDGLNKFGWENPEAEGLFEQLRGAALDETNTREATEKLQRVFLADPPALFLAWSERARVVGPKFKPIIDDDRDPVLTMWRWTPTENRVAAAR
jgi:ABC-type transport system substrate-binding protein